MVEPLLVHRDLSPLPSFLHGECMGVLACCTDALVAKEGTPVPEGSAKMDERIDIIT